MSEAQDPTRTPPARGAGGAPSGGVKPSDADATAPAEGVRPSDGGAPTGGAQPSEGAATAPAGGVKPPDADATAPTQELSPEEAARVAAERKAEEYLLLARRTQADFENYRKRMARDSAQAADRGAARLAKELLPALDHLELALRASAEHEGADDVVKGFRLVQEELVSALGRVGIEPFSPAGERFDPVEHEAMAQQPRDGAETGTVIEVYQQGYRLNGAVLRPARVVVAG